MKNGDAGHEIKVYSLASRFAFQVKRMEDIYDEAAGRSDTLHRHDYYTVIWVIEGEGRHTIDFNTYPLAGNAVFFVTPGQVHQVNTIDRPRGWVITFSKEFLQHEYIDEGFIQEVNLFRSFGESPPLLIDAPAAAKLSAIVEMMAEAYNSHLPHKIAALGALLKLFLIYCDTQCTLDEPDVAGDHKGKQLLKTFKTLVAENFRTQH